MDKVCLIFKDVTSSCKHDTETQYMSGLMYVSGLMN